MNLNENRGRKLYGSKSGDFAQREIKIMGFTRKGIESRISKKIDEFLFKRGFSKSGIGGYDKKTNNDFLRISFVVNTVSDIKGNFVIGYSFSLRINEIEEIWEKYRTILGEERRPLADTIGFGRAVINPSSNKYPEHRFAKGGGEFIKEEEDLFKYIDEFKQEYEELMLPFIEKVKDIKWLDSIINTEIENISSKTQYISNIGFWYKRIIIAKLANNQDYEVIYKWIRNRFQKGYEESGNEKYKSIVTVLDNVYFDLNAIDLI